MDEKQYRRRQLNAIYIISKKRCGAEMIYSAMQELKRHPEISIEDALKIGYNEWNK